MKTVNIHGGTFFCGFDTVAADMTVNKDCVITGCAHTLGRHPASWTLFLVLTREPTEIALLEVLLLLLLPD